MSQSNDPAGVNGDEAQIRQLINEWAAAVRSGDIEAILAHHADDIVMYDVPKPFRSVGLEAYRRTWDTFFTFTKPGVFDILELHIVAGEKVAFCFAIMKCADKSNSLEYVDLDFRLTVGLKKINEQWTIVHEHHSVPSE
jgi:ketosteroid isomerase-like protein